MSIHARQLPTNARKVLDELVDPNTGDARSSPERKNPASHELDTAVPPREAAVPPESRSGTDSSTHADAQFSGGTDLPWYRRETWLAVQIAAIVPILGAMVVPETYRLPLCVVGGALVAVGTVMLLRHKPMRPSSGSAGA